MPTRNRFRYFSAALVCALLLLTGATASAQIRLPRLISDNVVLQRDQDLELWGWASPGERIRIDIAGARLRTRADGEGNWSVTLPAQPAGGPFEMTLIGENELTIGNVSFGDVWVCSGQSNMTVWLERVKEIYAEEIAAADEPEIREFFVPTMTELAGPREDFPEGEWKAVTPETVMDMSAIGYFFARRLHETYDIPIGIINTAVGGTPIEAWTSAEGLRSFPELRETIARNSDPEFLERLNAPRAGGGRPAGPPPVTDQGLIEAWYAPDYEPRGWQPYYIPGYWEDQGVSDLNGSVWFRREIDIPAEWAGKELKLFMGRIVDADAMYVNGQQIGNITYQYPPRRYVVPEGLLREGKNLLTVRVMNYGGKGGFVPDKTYVLTDGKDSMDLKGTWQYKVGEVYVPRARGGGGGFSFSAQNQPSALYNAMIAPIERFAVKGFNWYQGESNVGGAQEYYQLLPALIRDWRDNFDQGALPFLTVQLANFQDATYVPVESQWAVLRDAQLQSLKLPNTGLAVAIDIGEWNDIHPLNKKDVAERLALEARRIAYGEVDLVSTGPLYASASVDADSLRIRFDRVGRGLTTTDGLDPQYFSIAGYDREYHWAEARIEGDEVIVWSDAVTDPRYVRYAWADNPFGANLTNDTGLPASPFQSDNRVATADSLWRGKQAGVVLTYDDALTGQLDRVVPLLDSLNLKASFYLTASFPGFQNRLEDWRRVARSGHELGNHTLYHPCDARGAGREWVAADNDLSKYTTDQLLREIDVTNSLLQALDGESERTFAYTCGDTATADGSFKEALQDRFIAARGTTPGLDGVGSADLYDLHTYVANGHSAEEMIAWIERAKEENALVTLLFHGVGGGHDINVSEAAHRELVEYLYRNQDELWVTTLRDVSRHMVDQAAIINK
ncbi:sialate O-acetylesterase [Neolewinella xylanilytica]|uniref:Sialate O-acetylesterase n=1 Tax=Neolewinella xylanilytica TaxID=1514080 RepID=A0A2S6I2N4_9BACT|nr:sialate O-acetylesterase [Neolewinella xylanilytica]PPK85425.1 sialate O-acetylesterase [Neolewinella xylanilytica]